MFTNYMLYWYYLLIIDISKKKRSQQYPVTIPINSYIPK